MAQETSRKESQGVAGKKFSILEDSQRDYLKLTVLSDEQQPTGLPLPMLMILYFQPPGFGLQSAQTEKSFKTQSGHSFKRTEVSPDSLSSKASPSLKPRIVFPPE